MLEYVSILDFFKTGELGGIKLGMTMEAIEEVLGEAVFYTVETSIDFYALEGILKYIDLSYNNCYREYPEQIASYNQISTKMGISWECVRGTMDDDFASKIIEMNLVDDFNAEELGWTCSYEDPGTVQIGGDVSEFGYSITFNSGVTIKTIQKDYHSIDVQFGEKPKGVKVWKFKTYWDKK